MVNHPPPTPGTDPGDPAGPDPAPGGRTPDTGPGDDEGPGPGGEPPAESTADRSPDAAPAPAADPSTGTGAPPDADPSTGTGAPPNGDDEPANEADRAAEAEVESMWRAARVGRPDGRPSASWPIPEPESDAAPVRDFSALEDTGAGDAIIRSDVWATVAFAGLAGLAAAYPDTFTPVSVPFDLVLFAVGTLALLWAYIAGLLRSRREAVALGGLFFLAGNVAPTRVRRAFHALLAIQVVAAVATAAVRPFTELAFGVLVPAFGVGFMALWSARQGRFPPKT
jgi:hypothetical protein